MVIKKKNSSGLSLIEILIVLGILATVFSLFTFQPRNTQKDYRRFIRRFSHFTKEIRNKAQIENATYRMMIQFKLDAPVQIWVEKSTEKVLLGDEKETKEKFQDLLKNIEKNIGKNKDSSLNKEPPVDSFKKYSRFNFDKLSPPEGMLFLRIEVNGLSEPLVSNGLIAFHFFPQGQVEQTAITIANSDKSLTWTLLIDPLTGALIPFAGEKTLKELQRR